MPDARCGEVTVAALGRVRIESERERETVIGRVAMNLAHLRPRRGTRCIAVLATVLGSLVLLPGTAVASTGVFVDEIGTLLVFGGSQSTVITVSGSAETGYVIQDTDTVIASDGCTATGTVATCTGDITGIWVDGGAGNDKVNLRNLGPLPDGGSITAYGGTGDDVIDGSDFNDGLHGDEWDAPAGGGSDRLNGHGGDDLIQGDDGSDGDDVLVGGPGRDDLRGLGGDDELVALDGQQDGNVDCGPGQDAAAVDPTDQGVTGCEVSAGSGPLPGGPCPAGQIGASPVCVNNPTPGSGQFSTSCTDGNAKVVDGFTGSVYVSLRVQKNPTNAQETWACYRAWSTTGSVDVGGRVDFDQGGISAPLPVVEPDSSGCSVTPVNLAVGPDETPVLVGVNSTSSQARACLRVGSFQQRVTVTVPSVGGAVPQVNQDDATVPDPIERQGNPAHPSSTCQSTPGHTRLANLEAGGTWISVYSAPGGPGETRLCVRAQGPVSHGGMLTLKSSLGIAPVVQGPVADTAPSSCTSNVLANNSDPARFSIRVSASNPASLCLSVGSSGQFGPPGQRFTLGTSGSPSAPAVWTPDPGTPG